MPLQLKDDSPKNFPVPQYLTLEERFLKHVEKTDGCWLWTGFVRENGYAVFSIGTQRPLVHRFSYELWVGEIPKNMVIDHLCHNDDSACAGGWDCMHRRCVNPDHLSATTQADNLLRSELTRSGRKVCKRGHEFGEQRPSDIARGRRQCITCCKEKDRIRDAKRWQEVLLRRKQHATIA